MPHHYGSGERRRRKKASAIRRRAALFALRQEKIASQPIAAPAVASSSPEKIYKEDIGRIASISDRELLPRATVSRLQQEGIRTVADLLKKGRAGLLQIRGIGAKKVAKIRDALSEHSVLLPE